MPEQVRCPSCNAALRVPENLLGKNVRCPKCQTTFLAEMDEPAEPERIVQEPRPAARRRPRPPEDFEEDELPQEEELDELPEEPEEEYEERPRRRRRKGRRRADAEAAVSAPAIALLVLGILGILTGIGNILYAFLGTPLQNPPPGFQLGRYIGAFVSLIWAIIIVAGAVNMKGLRSYGSAMTACIVACVPCSLCCLLGIPFGIWGLIALNKPGVKDAFS